MFHLATTRRAGRGMKREWRLHVLAVFSLAVSFVCLVSALLVVTNVNALSERWGQTARLTVYLKDNAAATDVEDLKGALVKLPHVQDVKYVSGTQAHAEFSAREARIGSKEELMGLPADAFPSSIELSLRSLTSKDDVTKMVGLLSRIPAVEEVETYDTWTDRLASFVRGGVVASLLFSFVVLISVLAIVGSTIRLVLHRRRAEVEVLRLVGATNKFVKRPFLVEGGAQGALGAASALFVVLAFFGILKSHLDSSVAPFLGIEVQFLHWGVALGIIVFGALLGVSAAALGLRKLVMV